MRLYTYKMTTDIGFAPNPFCNILTLATCKPTIRRCADRGDMLVGFTAKTGHRMNGKVGKILYIGIIDKIVTLGEYFNNPSYDMKKPDMEHDKQIYKVGDNCYRKDSGHKLGFEQLHCMHSNRKTGLRDDDRAKWDISGENVLICSDFMYFGNKAVDTPPNLQAVIPNRGHRSKSNNDYVERFVSHFEYLKQKPKYHSSKIHGRPFSWGQDDSSWKEQAHDSCW